MGVNALVFSPDGSLLLSAGADHAVKIWSVRTGALLRELIGHTADVKALAFLPEPDRALSASSDGTVKLWNVRTGELLKTLKGHRGGVKALGVSPDGKMAAVASSDRRVRAIRLGGAWEATLWRVPTAVSSVAWSPDGAGVFLGHEAGDITAWDPATGRQLGRYQHDPKHRREVTAIGALPGGQSVLIGARSEGLLRWDLNGGEPGVAWSTGEAAGAVEDLSFSPDGARVLAAVGKRGLALYDVATGSLLRTLSPDNNAATCVAYSPDGLHAASGGRWQMNLWDLVTGQSIRRLGRPASDTRDIAVSPDGTRVLAAYRNFDIRLWDLSTISVTGAFEVNRGTIRSAAFLDGGERVIAATVALNPDHTGIQVWDTASGALLQTFSESVDDFEEAINTMQVLPNGKRVLLERIMKQRIELWDIEAEKPIRQLQSDSRLLTIGPDGATFLSVNHGTLRMWDMTTMALRATLKAHIDEVTSAAYSSNGRFIVSAGVDATMRLWNVADGSLVKTYYGHENAVTAVALSPNDVSIASGSSDGAVRLWRRDNGALIRTFTGHTDTVTSLRFLKDGRRLLSASDDGTIRVWKIDGDASLVLVASGSDWMTYTSDGFFDASRSGGSLLSVTHELDSYPVSFVAARANRPDVILQQFGVTSPSTINQLRREVEARLGSQGPFDGLLSGGAPTVHVKVAQKNERSASLELEVRSATPLRRYNVFVNATPLYGPEGQAALGTRMNVTLGVDLGYGANEIVVYAVDSAGNVGASSPHVIPSSRWMPPILHYVGIGTDRHLDSKRFAEPAARNAIDLGEALRATEGREVAQVKATLWTNEKATADVVRGLDKTLADAAPDDIVIVLLSGRAAPFGGDPMKLRYFPVDASTGAPSATGIGLEEIDVLLARVKARRKLLILDVTGIGSNKATTPAGDGGVRAARGDRRIDTRDRYVFNDLRRRSGTIVALCGDIGEQCREATGGSRSLFTHEIRRAFMTGAPDVDGDGRLSIDEIRAYVQRRVASSTNGEQNPIFWGHPGWSFALPVARSALGD